MTLNTLPRRRYAGLLAVLALALPIAVSAHTAWLVPVDAAATWKLQFGGHQGRLEPAVADKLRQVSAIDAQGQALPVRRTQDGADITLAVDGQPALLALHYDNGIHTRTGRGPSVERPMNEVTGAVSAVNFAGRLSSTVDLLLVATLLAALYPRLAAAVTPRSNSRLSDSRLWPVVM